MTDDREQQLNYVAFDSSMMPQLGEDIDVFWCSTCEHVIGFAPYCGDCDNVSYVLYGQVSNTNAPVTVQTFDEWPSFPPVLPLRPSVVTDVPSGEQCAICLTEMNSGDDVQVVALPCTHMFHRTCMNQWEKPTCPMCRRVFGK